MDVYKRIEFVFGNAIWHPFDTLILTLVTGDTVKGQGPIPVGSLLMSQVQAKEALPFSGPQRYLLSVQHPVGNHKTLFST